MQIIFGGCPNFSEGDYAMKKIFPELPGWVFHLDEVSGCVYEVVGSDKNGHIVSAQGTDLERLIEQCKKDAFKIISTGVRSTN